MKKTYKNAEAEVVRLDGSDVLTTSRQINVCNFKDVVEDADSFNALFGIQ